MQKVTKQTDLKIMIAKLEVKQLQESTNLRAEVLNTYEKLKPLNVIKNTFKETLATTDRATDVFGNVLELGVSIAVWKNQDFIQLALNKLTNFFKNQNKYAE